MYKIDVGFIYGHSVLYKDDEKVEKIKKINDHLTILHFLEEQNDHQSLKNMTNILTKVSERDSQSPPLVGSSLPE
jgi:hypothetical protein